MVYNTMKYTPILTGGRANAGAGDVAWNIIFMTMALLCISSKAGAADKTCVYGLNIQQIDETKHICCNGIYNKTDGHGFEQDCCMKVNDHGKIVKSEVFSTKNKICCEGMLMDLHTARNSSSPKPVCCGQDYFYPEFQICCNNKTYDRLTHDCSRDDCGEVVYIPRDDMRCPHQTVKGWCSKIHRKQDGFRCCGPDLYNTKTHKCFYREPWPLDAYVSRCGGVTYDMAKNVCCEGQNHDTFTLRPIPKQGNTKTKYLGTTSDYSCLEDKIFDRDLAYIAETEDRKQIVPNHFLPCGDTYYDPSNKRNKVDCCQGVVNKARPEMNVTCCGNEFIDLNKYVCCNNTKIESNMMCCGGNQIYSRVSGLECCGSRLINNSFICCKMQSSLFEAVEKEKGHDMCCGRKTYNSHSNKVCCAGKIIEVKQNEICKNGHIIAFNETDAKKVKDRIRTMAENTGFRELKRKPDCSSCKTYNNPPKICEKKFEYQLYIRKITFSGVRTSIHVLFLEPYNLRKTKMKLSTKGHCRCFQEDELYILQTNRNILDKAKAGKNKLRVSGRDVFRNINGEFPTFKVQGQCKIYRYLRKPIKS